MNTLPSPCNRIAEVIRAKSANGFRWNPTEADFKRLGIGKKRFGQLVRNEKQPDLIELQQLALFFGIRPVELFPELFQ